MTQRYIYVCANCGSKDVWSDASAYWNEVRQTWELLAVFQQEHCENCGGDTNLITKELL